MLKKIKNKYFGTDGVRGPINQNTNPEFVLKLGWAAGKIFFTFEVMSRVSFLF